MRHINRTHTGDLALLHKRFVENMLFTKASPVKEKWKHACALIATTAEIGEAYGIMQPGGFDPMGLTLSSKEGSRSLQGPR